jgi:hypothetical protein
VTYGNITQGTFAGFETAHHFSTSNNIPPFQQRLRLRLNVPLADVKIWNTMPVWKIAPMPVRIEALNLFPLRPRLHRARIERRFEVSLCVCHIILKELWHQ